LHFCKSNSDSSKSVEHILPESLGNVEHTLPPGWVCDACNNYFAREVEKPFLESAYGTLSRFEMAVPNKRGRIPAVKGLHPQSCTVVEFSYSPEDGMLCVGAAEGQNAQRWIASAQSRQPGSFYLPSAIDPPPADKTTSRFLAKLGLEILAKKCISVAGANNEIVNQSELDAIRRYVRLGTPNEVWPVSIRRIYAPDFHFNDLTHGPHQVLHEWMILGTSASEYYAVIAIFGIEYAINLGGPEIDGFIDWLKSHDGRSPLYDDSFLGNITHVNTGQP
jgi:hypothetical protein